MKRKSLLTLSALLVPMIVHAGSPGQSDLSHQQAPTRLLVKYKAELLQRAGPTSFAAIAGVKAKDQKLLRGGVSVVSLDDPADTVSAYESLRQSDAVEYVEYDVPIHAVRTPNDSDFSDLWGLHNVGQSGGVADIDINADIAWDHTTGGDVVIGVVDSGVDYTHPDLAANIWVNQAELNGEAGVDDDNNGYIDDFHGIDTYNNDSDPMDDNDHGTHVSGTIAAVGNNGTGVVGVNWNAKIVSCKSLNGRGSGYISQAITCMDYFLALKESGVNIVVTNHSWSGPFVQAFTDAVQLHDDAGLLVVAAAGNEGRLVENPRKSQAFYPAAIDLDNVISVAAINRNGELAGFSNYGSASVDIGAPGVDILSTIPGNGYDSFNGTSMATPHVTGVVALLNAAHPGIDHLQLREFIFNAGKPLNSLAGKTVSGKMLRIEFDNDYDSMPNSWEQTWGLNFNSAADKELDSDSDGLMNYLEFKHGTNPTVADSDSDGLLDGDEVLNYGSDPLNPDTDGDGLSDGVEADAGTNLLNEDNDGDGLSDAMELELGTDPNLADSDSDGMDDGWEYDNDLNPLFDDGKLDSDSDGFENILEYKAGTNPKDAESLPAEGTYLWSKAFENSVSAMSVGINGEILFTEAGDYVSQTEFYPGHLVAVDRFGEELWRYNLGYAESGEALRYSYVTPLVLPDGFIYVVSGSVIQKLTSTGQLVWRKSATENANCPISERALNIDGGIIVMCGGSLIVAFDANGEERWRHSSSYGSRPSLVVDGDGSIYYVQFNRLVKLNQFGEEQWVTTIGTGSVLNNPVLAGDTIYLTQASYSSNPDVDQSNLFAVNLEGHIIWKRELGDRTLNEPVVDSSGNIYVSATNSSLYKYSSTGSRIWKKTLSGINGNVTGYLTLDSSNGLYFTAGPGNESVLAYLSDTDQDVTWQFLTNTYGSRVAPVILPGAGMIVFPGNNEIIAIRHQGYEVAQSAWPTFEGSFQRTNNKMIDVDSDWMDDVWESEHGLQVGVDDALLDLDNDELVNRLEYRGGTMPDNEDSDGDSLLDGEEVSSFGTDPLAQDTDGDGLSDSQELQEYNSDPLITDTDGDELSDYDEAITYGTDPQVVDTDGDTLSDGREVDLGTDPNVENAPWANLTLSLKGINGGDWENGLIRYKNRVIHNEAFDATNVTVTNTIPDGVEFVSAEPELGDCNYAQPVLTCELELFEDNTDFDILVTVATDDSESSFTFEGSVEAEGPFDPNPFDNTDEGSYGGCGCGETCASPSANPDPTLPAFALFALGGIFTRRKLTERTNESKC